MIVVKLYNTLSKLNIMSSIHIIAIDKWDPSMCSMGPITPIGDQQIYYKDYLFGLTGTGRYTLTPKSIILSLDIDDESQLTKFDQCMAQCYHNLAYVSCMKEMYKSRLLIHPCGGKCFIDGHRVGWDSIPATGQCKYKIRPILNKTKDKYTIRWILLQIDVMRDMRLSYVLYDDTDNNDVQVIKVIKD